MSIFQKKTEWGLSRPYQVKRLADLPDRLRQLAEPSLQPDEPVNTIFVVPPQLPHRNQKGQPHPLAEQALVFTSQGILHLLAEADEAPPVTYLHGADILYAHQSLILLYGRLELGGASDGRLARIVVEYNTVGLRFLQPAVQQLLTLAEGQTRVEASRPDATKALLETLGAQSFKFKNCLRGDALRPGEPLLGFVFQPRRIQRRWYVFRQLRTPATLFALTDREVILVEEDNTSYGWLMTFCPRVCITSIESQTNQGERDLCVRLTRNNVTWERQIRLESPTVQAWEDLWLNQNR
jgi:hypothetical protein